MHRFFFVINIYWGSLCSRCIHVCNTHNILRVDRVSTDREYLWIVNFLRERERGRERAQREWIKINYKLQIEILQLGNLKFILYKNVNVHFFRVEPETRYVMTHLACQLFVADIYTRFQTEHYKTMSIFSINFEHGFFFLLSASSRNLKKHTHTDTQNFMWSNRV